MYCQKCGSKLPEDALFCQKCGEKVLIESGVNQSSEAPATTEGAPVEMGGNISGTVNGGAEQTYNNDKQDKRVYGDDIKPYYREQFERISSGEKPKFNWAAFFLNGWIQLYHGCTGIFCKTFLPYLVVSFLLNLISMVSIWNLNFAFMLILPVLGVIIAVVGIALNIINGFKFNIWYYQDVINNPEKKRSRKGFWILLISEIAAVIVTYALPKVLFKSAYVDVIGEESDYGLVDAQVEDGNANLSETYEIGVESEFTNVSDSFYAEHEEDAETIILDWFERHPLMDNIKIQFVNEAIDGGIAGNKYLVYEMYLISGEKYGVFLVNLDSREMIMDSLVDNAGDLVSIQVTMEQWYLDYYWGWTDDSGYYAENYSEDLVIIYDEMNDEILEYNTSYDSYAICNFDGQCFIEYDDGSAASEISIIDFAGIYGYDASFEAEGEFVNFYYSLEIGGWDGYGFSITEEWRGNAILQDESARAKTLIVDTLIFDVFGPEGYETHTLTYIPAKNSPLGQDVIYIDGDDTMPFVRG